LRGYCKLYDKGIYCLVIAWLLPGWLLQRWCTVIVGRDITVKRLKSYQLLITTECCSLFNAGFPPAAKLCRNAADTPRCAPCSFLALHRRVPLTALAPLSECFRPMGFVTFPTHFCGLFSTGSLFRHGHLPMSPVSLDFAGSSHQARYLCHLLCCHLPLAIANPPTTVENQTTAQATRVTVPGTRGGRCREQPLILG
jgi:hypothetical protein